MASKRFAHSVAAPHEGALALRDIGVAVGIAAGFVILCWVRNSYRRFAAALAGFCLLNIVSWRYLVRLLEAPIRDSYAQYRRDASYIELEKLKIVRDYITDRWQWWRFAAGSLMVVLNVLAWLDVKPGYAAPSIFAFVIIVESWIWFMRLRGKFALRLLDDFGERNRED